MMKQVFLPLCKKGMLLVMNMEEIEEDSDTAKLCCQVLQCVDAMFEELAEEEEGGVVAGVLMGWSEEEIKGPSIDPEDKGEEISLPVEDLDDGDESGWVFSTEETEDGKYDHLLEVFGILTLTLTRSAADTRASSRS